MHFFEASTSPEQLLFQKKKFFRGWYFFSAVNFSEMLVMRNQIYSIFIRRGFLLTIIHSLQYTMSWLEIEIPQFYIVESRKQCINFNTGCVKNVTIQKVVSNFGIFKQALESKQIPQHLWFKRCCCNNILKIAKKWTVRHF